MKKIKQYRFSVCYKSFRNDAKYNISSYLKIGNIFSSPRGWVHRFHLLGLILQKNNKIWEISSCKCRVFEYVSFLFYFQGPSAPGSICALLFSQVERSNMVVQLYRTSGVKTAQTKNWADLRGLYLRTQLCINRHLWFNILGPENTYTSFTKPILSQPQNKAIKRLFDHLIQSLANNDF